MQKNRIKDFFIFMNERHRIYLRKSNGFPWPWTNDKILQTYKFTNVFRELDTGTIWLRENIREPFANDPELFFNIAMYRLHNWWLTAEFIGYLTFYSSQYWVKMMTKRKENGHKIFTGAYMITGTLGGSKIEQIFGKCLPALWENRRELEPKPGDTLEKAWNRLNGNSPGFGPFVSYEVITDLRHTRYLNKAKDIMSWANPGPGAFRGIYRLKGLPVKSWEHKELDYPSKTDCINYMRWLLNISEDYLESFMPELEMRDIEHTLCEWDKYERARLGEGRPRSKYKH